jgi:hypothetical protein
MTRSVLLLVSIFSLGLGRPPLTFGQIPPGKHELVLNATVMYTGDSHWSQPGEQYDESVTVNVSGTTRWPMSVGSSGYLVPSGPPTKDYTISVEGYGTDAYDVLGTSKWSFYRASGWEDEDFFLGVNFSAQHGYADFGEGSFPPIAVDGVDVFGGKIDIGGWGYEALHSAWVNWDEVKNGRMTFATNAPQISASGQGLAQYSLHLTGPGTAPVQSQGSMQATFSITVDEPEFDVVIIPPDDFDQWIPQAGADEKTPGNSLVVRLEIRAKDATNAPAGQGTFEINLLNTSQEPGICLNFPGMDQATQDYDLQIGGTSEIQVAEDGQSGQTANAAQSCLVSLTSYDYGAYGQLRVQATVQGKKYMGHVDGQPDQYDLTVPVDDNQNHIADAWEKQVGVYDQNLPPDWDEVDYPTDHKSKGDGIGLYERYRGFQFQGLYERLTPTNKYVFVYDPDDLVKNLAQGNYSRSSSFPVVSGCLTRFVEDNEWTGPGKASAFHRVVNFNSSGFGHAVDQHAIQVIMDIEDTPEVPPDWDSVWKSKVSGGQSWGATNSLQNVLGMTWPDNTTSGFDSPLNTFLITVYPPLFETEIRGVVIYHTWGLPAYTNYLALSPADRQKMEDAVAAAADAYIAANPDAKKERYFKRLADVTTHEMGHGLGIRHHAPTGAGEMECVLRYFGVDFPRNPNDRFELTARSPWPDIYCRSANHTANGRGCWYQIKVTDR